MGNLVLSELNDQPTEAVQRYIDHWCRRPFWPWRMPCRRLLRMELYWGLMRQVLKDQMADVAEPSPVKMTEAQHVDGKSVGTILLHGILCPERRMLIALQIKR